MTSKKATHKTSLLAAAAQRCLVPGCASNLTNLPTTIQRGNFLYASSLLTNNRKCWWRFSSSHTTNVVAGNNTRRRVSVNLKQQTSGNQHRQRHQALAQKTQSWLDIPLGSWSRKDVALGRSLFEDWLRLPSSTPDRAPWAHDILSRWIQEKNASCRSTTSNNTNNKNHLASHELLDMLHRVLYAWKMRVVEVADDHHHQQALEEVRSILQQMEQLYQTTNDEHLRPGDKAYSMMLQVLALSSPKHNPDACEEAMELLNKLCLERSCKIDTAPDLVVWNSCLHVLAKYSLHQSDAPEQAEHLLEQMMMGSCELVDATSSSSSTSTTSSLTTTTTTTTAAATTITKVPIPDTTSFALVLEAWSNSRRPGAATRARAILDRMIRQQQDDDARVPAPNTTCFNICIDAYAKSPDPGSARRAQDLLEYMLNNSANTQEATKIPTMQPDHISFLSTMKAWAEECAQEPEAAVKAEALLQNMQSLHDETGNPSFRPTASCYAVVLDAWSRTPNAGPKVEKILQQMQEMELQEPTLVEQHSDQPQPMRSSYLSAIRAWGNTANISDAPEQAEALLQKLLDEQALDTSGVVNQKNALAPYSAVIGAWSKSPRAEAPHRALAFLRRIQRNAVDQNGPSPNTVIYNSVLNAFARKGYAVSAIELLEEMKTQYNSGNLDVQPDAISYSTTINGLARTRDLPDAAQSATELLEELVELYAQTGDESLRPTAYTYSSVILAWSNSHRMDSGEQAENTLWKMVELCADDSGNPGQGGPKPTTIVCNCVLRAWARSTEGGAAEHAEAILEWMKSQCGANSEVSPDRSTFRYILQTWARSRRVSSIQRIEGHLNHMIQEANNGIAHPLFPDASCYNCLLEALQRSRRDSKAQQCLSVLEQLLQSSSADESIKLWNLQTFHNVFLACLHSPQLGGEVPNMEIRRVLHATFKHLTSTNADISNWTVELILRAYAKIGECDDDAFLLDVFQFCYSKRNSIVNPKRVLVRLQGSVSELMYENFQRNETKARKNTRIS